MRESPRSFPDTSRGRAAAVSFQRARPHLPGRRLGAGRGTSRGGGGRKGLDAPGGHVQRGAPRAERTWTTTRVGWSAATPGLARVLPAGPPPPPETGRDAALSDLGTRLRCPPRGPRGPSGLGGPGGPGALAEAPGRASRRRRGFSYFLPHPSPREPPRGPRRGAERRTEGTFCALAVRWDLLLPKGASPHSFPLGESLVVSLEVGKRWKERAAERSL